MRINEDDDFFTHEPDYATKLTLKDAISSLSYEQNELFFLRVHSNYSYAEIAEMTNQTVENVSIKLFRVRQKLKNIMKD